MPDIQPQASEYSSLNLRTRSWEVPRGSVAIEKIIGKGAFGQVAKATVENLRGARGKETVAVKMLKGEYIVTPSIYQYSDYWFAISQDYTT